MVTGMLPALLLATRLAITVATPRELVSADVATLAAEEADAVWRRAGLDIQWSVGDRPGWQPDAPMLYVIFTDRCVGEADGAMPLASITFVHGEPTRRIVVCENEVRAVAERGDPQFRSLPERARDAVTARVIGRAVAHEIGHYLLGPDHGPAGLMRARHSAAELCAVDTAGFVAPPFDRLARTLPAR